jgi:hypothetical protein
MSAGCFNPKDPVDAELERKADRLLEPDFSDIKQEVFKAFRSEGLYYKGGEIQDRYVVARKNREAYRRMK